MVAIDSEQPQGFFSYYISLNTGNGEKTKNCRIESKVQTNDIMSNGPFDLQAYIHKTKWKEQNLAVSQKSLRALFQAPLQNQEYSQLLPCGHPAITDTLIIQTAAKSRAKTNYRRLTWNKLPLLQTLVNEDTNWRSLQCPLWREMTVVKSSKW